MDMENHYIFLRSGQMWHLDSSMCIICWMFICLFTFSCRHWVAELSMLLLCYRVFSISKTVGIPSWKFQENWNLRNVFAAKVLFFLPLLRQYQQRSSLRLNIIFTYKEKKNGNEWDRHGSLQQSVVMVTGIIIFMHNCVLFFISSSLSCQNHWHSFKGIMIGFI